MLKKIGIGVVILLVTIQFIPVELNESDEVTENDFMAVEKPPLEIQNLLQTSCYDCHSNNTEYPWFDKIAPVNFWVNDHIQEGKSELNFSEWGTYTEKRKLHKLKEILEEIDEEKMPLESYVWMHGETKVSAEEYASLEQWISSRK